jgi:hypothetical protein
MGRGWLHLKLRLTVAAETGKVQIFSFVFFHCADCST